METLKSRFSLEKVKGIENNIVTLDLENATNNDIVVNDITELILKNREKYQKKHSWKFLEKAKNIYRIMGIGLFLCTIWTVCILGIISLWTANFR